MFNFLSQFHLDSSYSFIFSLFFASLCCVRGNSFIHSVLLANSHLSSNKPYHLSTDFLGFFWGGPLRRHMEVPRLGVKSELQEPAYTASTAMQDAGRICNMHHRSLQRWILNPLSEAKDQTCILMDTSWIVSTVPQQELLN